MKLTIGILTSEGGRFARFWNSLLMMDMPKGTNIVTKLGLNIVAARNEVIRESKNSDYVWFIDDDHTFEKDLVSNLILRNVPVVQPLVLSRQSPFGPLMMGEPAEDKPGFYKRIALDLKIPSHGLIELNAVGAAGMLIRRDVLNKINDPWFENSPGKINEDITFCEKVRKAGFSIYTDLSNVMTHLNVGSVKPIFRNGEWQTELMFGDGIYYLPAVKGKTE